LDFLLPAASSHRGAVYFNEENAMLTFGRLQDKDRVRNYRDIAAMPVQVADLDGQPVLLGVAANDAVVGHLALELGRFQRQAQRDQHVIDEEQVLDMSRLHDVEVAVPLHFAAVYAVSLSQQG